MPGGAQPYQSAIVRNADWFVSRQKAEGYIDADGDEFYGIRGDATLVGHSVTVRMYAHAITGETRYLESARRSLEWLAARQDGDGGWRKHAAFTLDGAQCVFEGFNTYQRMSGDRRFQTTLERAADRMLRGTIAPDGRLILANVIEIGEYAHFAMLAAKTTSQQRYRTAAKTIVEHICRNFDDGEGYWCPYDRGQPAPSLRPLLRPVLRATTRALPMRGRLMARLADHLLAYVAAPPRPQYSMSLMDSEALLDTLDGSCAFPRLREQTVRAIDWAKQHCAGPFRGSLVESKPTPRAEQVYPVEILNDTTTAALWPSTCLLLAYCGLDDPSYRDDAQATADWILTTQDDTGAFRNFQKPDGSFLPLCSGNVSFYASLSLWAYAEIYGDAGTSVWRG